HRLLRPTHLHTRLHTSSRLTSYTTSPAPDQHAATHTLIRTFSTCPSSLASHVQVSSRPINIMRFRPANIRLINRRSNPPRLLLALSSNNNKKTTPRIRSYGQDHSISGKSCRQ